MSNKVILLTMAGLLLGGLFAVLFVLHDSDNEKTEVAFVPPTSDTELVSELLEVARARAEGARAVRERGVTLRPVREYATSIGEREALTIERLETWPNNGDGEDGVSIDWWGMSESELAESYVYFEQEQNQHLKQLLGEGRLFKDEASRDLVKQWADTVRADEAQLQELAGLLPAI